MAVNRDFYGFEAPVEDHLLVLSVFEKYEEALNSYILSSLSRYNLGNKDASEIYSRTYDTALRRTDALRESKNQRGWLCMVAENHIRHVYRRQKAFVPDVDLDTAPHPSSTGEISLGLDEWMSDDISPTEQQVLRLHYDDKLTVSEISEDLGVGLSAVKQRLKRGRDKIRIE